MNRSGKAESHDATGMHILFADDEKNLQELMRTELPRMGYRVTVCPDGLTAVAALEKEPFDCLLVDLDMPGLNGIEVIGKARELRPEIEAVVMTGKPSQDTAIKALRYQAFDYLTKPCRLAELAGLLGRVGERRHNRRQLAALEHRLRRAEGDSTLVGSGAAMDSVKRLIAKVAPTESTVMIRGETGCGKELVARAVQQSSLRAEQPLVAINCGALPENLIESELFGHCRGAYTGADTARTGLFEVADGGTIFLDEIGELPIAMQAKLLRVLETGEIRRLGDNQIVQVDVRVICATHRDLERMVEEGTFREDLMFRINTFEICVPALRERVEDIPVLAEHLLRRHRSDGADQQLFTEAAMERLKSHSWPGNVRELANVVEHAAILCESLPIDSDDLPQHFGKRQLRKEIRDSEPKTLRELEMVAIEDSLRRHDGNKPAVAAELGVSLKTLYNKLNSADEKKRSA
jgi:two-component system NtrC family response regulator